MASALETRDPTVSERTIVVSGLPVGLLKDQLVKRYFPDEGGHVEEVIYPSRTKGVAYIIFKEKKVAQNVIRQRRYPLASRPQLTISHFSEKVFNYVMAILDLSVFRTRIALESLVMELKKKIPSLNFSPLVPSGKITVQGSFLAIMKLKQVLISKAISLSENSRKYTDERKNQNRQSPRSVLQRNENPAATLGTSAATLGTSAATLGTSAAAFGTSSATLETSAAAFGTAAATLGTSAAALGTSAAALGTSAAALGTSAAALGTSAVTLGTPAATLGTSAAALGTSAPESARSQGTLVLDTDIFFYLKHKCEFYELTLNKYHILCQERVDGDVTTICLQDAREGSHTSRVRHVKELIEEWAQGLHLELRKDNLALEGRGAREKRNIKQACEQLCYRYHRVLINLHSTHIDIIGPSSDTLLFKSELMSCAGQKVT